MSAGPAKAPQQSFWSKTKTSSKGSFDWLWRQADKLGDPVNKFSNKLGSEAFWPTDLQRESEKAARILKSFCKDGFYDEEITKTAAGPTAKQRVVKKIPADVIKNCKGLAIFTTMRTGLWFSGAGGSGIVVAKKEDGTWAGPIGIMLHTAGVGFMAGVDIYDCVLVLNTQNAVDAFSRWRATIGGELSVVAGPVGAGAVLESEIHKRQAPIFTYMKSRGFYAGVQIDGTVIIERTDENERFWGQKLSAKDILAGKGQSRKMELEVLTETLKAAQGDPSARMSLMPTEQSPSDFEIVEPGYTFGVPDPEDDDPYGVRALEKQGLLIREASSKAIAPEEEFEFNPKPTSPAFRSSVDTTNRSVRSSWRESVMTRRDSNFSSRSSKRYTTTDMSTQTDFPITSVSAPPTQLLTQNEFAESPKEADEDAYEAKSEGAITPISKRAPGPPPMLPPRERVSLPAEEQLMETGTESATKPSYTDATTEPAAAVSRSSAADMTLHSEPGPAIIAGEESQAESKREPKVAKADEDAPITVQHVKVQQASRPQMVKLSSGGPRLVQVAKRLPPKLPERNPGRTRGVTPTESLNEMSPARSDKAASTFDGSHEGRERRRGSETSEDKASSFKSNDASDSTEGDKVDTLQLPGGFPTSTTPPAIPARSRSREQIANADVKEADSKGEASQTAPGHQEDTTLQTREDETAKESEVSPLDAKRALLEQKLKGLNLSLGETKKEQINGHAVDTNDAKLKHESLTPNKSEELETPLDDKLHPGDVDDFSDDDYFSDAEIVTATTQVAAAPRKAPMSLGPRVSMAQIRSGLHSDDDRSPSPPRGRTLSRVSDDFA